MEPDVGSGAQALQPILHTKLHPPQLQTDLVNRDRLIRVVNSAQGVPLNIGVCSL